MALLSAAALTSGCALHRTSSAAAAGPLTEASVRAHMEFLAGDALNGRGSGTRDEWIAAAYVAAQMRQRGLEPLGDDGGFVKTIRIDRPEITAPPTLSMTGTTWTHGDKVIVLALSQARTAGPLHKHKPGTEAPAGAAVLISEPSAKVAAETSRAAILLVRASPNNQKVWRQLAAQPARMPASLGGVPPTPAAARVLLDESAFLAIEAAAEGSEVVLNAQTRPAEIRTWNAIGRLAGSDPRLREEVVLLSAHLDHLGNMEDPAKPGAADTIYNGADDDASGCVAVLELMQALAAGPRPRRTVVFTWFGSEETGGFGSRSFAARPPVPLERIVANLQFEMIGRPDAAVPARTLWLTGYERSTLGPELARRGARLVADPHPAQNFFERSDNIQLARRGVVAHTVSSYGLHKEYHQPSDEIRHVNFAHMAEAIRSLVGPVRWLANAPFRPEWLPGRKP